MSASRRESAVTTVHEALAAMDRNAQARAELKSAGVYPEVIASLYPESIFGGIAPSLIEHVATLSGTWLCAKFEECSRDLDRWRSAIPERVVLSTQASSSADFDARDDLIIAITRRLRTVQPNALYTELDTQAQAIADACWWVCWSATRRDQIAQHLRELSDRLTLTVASTLKLR